MCTATTFTHRLADSPSMFIEYNLNNNSQFSHVISNYCSHLSMDFKRQRVRQLCDSRKSCTENLDWTTTNNKNVLNSMLIANLEFNFFSVFVSSWSSLIIIYLFVNAINIINLLFHFSQYGNSMAIGAQNAFKFLAINRRVFGWQWITFETFCIANWMCFDHTCDTDARWIRIKF